MSIATQKKHNILIKIPTSKRKSDKGKNDIHIPAAHPRQVPETARYRPKPPDICFSQDENASNAVFNGNCTNHEVLESFKHYLTDREEYEIATYPFVYYIRQKPLVVRKTNPSVPVLLSFVKDEHIAYRYQMLSLLGEGSSGFVIKCHDHKKNEDVAIKALRDTRKSHEQIITERDYLMELQKDGGPEKCHIIKFKESFSFRGYYCLVMELASVNVYSTISAKPFKRLPPNQFMMVAKQTAESLAFMHSKGVIHSDVKPENILFNSGRRTAVRLIDFGCSCTAGHTLYTYIQSRFYRAPEVVLECPYGPEIDVWSYGCLLCEMYTGKALFEAFDEEELIGMMISLIGMPPESMIETANRAKYYFDEDGEPLDSLEINETSLYAKTKIPDQFLLSLIQGCLKWEPSERLTFDQIVQHDYFKHVPTAPRKSQYTRT